jgi:hypothetical protein
MDEVMKNVKNLRFEIENTQNKIKIVKIFMGYLVPVKFRIIHERYFCGLGWEQVAAKVNYSRKQCINIKDDALQDLLKLTRIK